MSKIAGEDLKEGDALYERGRKVYKYPETYTFELEDGSFIEVGKSGFQIYRKSGTIKFIKYIQFTRFWDFK